MKASKKTAAKEETNWGWLLSDGEPEMTEASKKFWEEVAEDEKQKAAR